MTPSALTAEELLTELERIDPDLKQHHAQLLPIIQELLKQKPDAVPSKAFVERLRKELRAHAGSRSHAGIAPDPAPAAGHSFLSFLWNPRLAPVLAVALIAVIGGYALWQRQPGTRPLFTGTDRRTDLFAYSVSKTGNRAFGDLSANPSQTGPAYGRGGGGGITLPASNPAPMAAQDAAGSEAGKIMIAPEINRITYVFSGAIELPTEQNVAVLKRQKNARLPFETIGQALDLGVMDLGSFSNRKVDTVTFTQEQEYGYQVTVALGEGTVSVSPNWQMWPHPEASCQDETCFQRYRLKPADVPEDAALIQIARAFATEHGIDLAAYGNPVVDRQWQREYNAAPDKRYAWVPDSLRVVFPMLVEGTPVVDEGGNPTGPAFNVNVRAKRVSDVWGLTNQRYVRSNYPAVTDSAQVSAYLKRIDAMHWDTTPAGTSVKEVTVPLGTPKRGYAVFYRPSEDGAVTDELLIPSLLFPVNAPANAPVWRKTIAVPLAQEMLEKAASQPEPRPMPLIAE